MSQLLVFLAVFCLGSGCLIVRDDCFPDGGLCDPARTLLLTLSSAGDPRQAGFSVSAVTGNTDESGAALAKT